MGLQTPGTVARLLTDRDAGSEAWWLNVARLGTPLLEAGKENNLCQVTFLWRDTASVNGISPTERVYLDINGITDHHSFSPESLRSLPDTDIWIAQMWLDDDWRGSYSLIPITGSFLPPTFAGTPESQRQQQRKWWSSLLPFVSADPLNPLVALHSSWGTRFSMLHMPAALTQQAWQLIDHHQAADIDPQRGQFFWQSAQLSNVRRCWLWRPTGDKTQLLPLVIVLDGQKWVEQMSLLPVLESETAQGRLPAANWLMIDSIDAATRGHELPCNASFWQAVITELLPEVYQRVATTRDPAATVVAGQSYGGLAALYAALFWPQHFACVVTQSGSFWWPEIQFITDFAQRESHQEGFLIRHVGESPPAQRLRIFLEAGLQEPDILYVNQQMYQALHRHNHHIDYRYYNGGHDIVCWRGGLIDGVSALLRPSSSSDNDLPQGAQ